MPNIFDTLEEWKKRKEEPTVPIPAATPVSAEPTSPVPEGLENLLNNLKFYKQKKEQERMNRDVEDIVHVEAANTFLQKFANVLNAPNALVGSAMQTLALQGIAHKNHVRTGIISGAISVPPEIKNAIISASDDDYSVDYAPQKKGYKLLGDKVVVRVKTGVEPKANIPGMVGRGALGSVAGSILGGLALGVALATKGVTDTPKKLGPKVQEYTLDNYDVQSYYDWLKEEDEEGRARWKRGSVATLKAGLGSLTGKYPTLVREGKQRVADFTSALVETAIPGTPQYAALSAVGFAGDVALPGALDVLPYVSRGIGKVITNATEVAKAVDKASDTEKVRKGVVKAILETPAVQEKLRRVSKLPVIGQLADMFGVRTKSYGAFESLVTAEKVEAQAVKKAIADQFEKTLTKIAPKEAKEAGKAFKPTVIAAQRKAFTDWALTQAGSDRIHKLLSKGQALDTIFDNPKLLSQIYGMKEADVIKYVGYHDMYWLMKSLEDPSFKSVLGDKTAKELRSVLNQVTQIQMDSGAHIWQGEVEYVPRKRVGSLRYPGTFVRSSSMTPEAFKRRTTTILHDYVKSIFEAKKGIVPDFNVFQLVAAHSEDAVNYSLQRTIEDKMLLSGIARKLKRSKGMTDVGTRASVLKAIEEGGAGDIPVMSPRVLENLKTTLKETGTEGKLAGYNVWYPVGRIRFYLDDTKRMLAKALNDATTPWKNTVGKVMRRVPAREAGGIREAIGALDTLYSKLKPDEMGSFLDALEKLGNNKVVQKYAKGTVAVTGRVPAYLVEGPVYDMIKAATKAMYSPEIARTMAMVRKFHRPFTSLMIGWNPGFWWRFNTFNPIQILNSGVELPMLIPRRVQGLRVLAKEGFTNIGGVKVANERVYDSLKGALSTFQGSVGANDYKLIMHSIYDVFNRGVVGRTTRKVIEAPGKVLDTIDGMDRLAVGIDHVAKVARKQGIKTEGEILRLLRSEGANHSRFYMYDYPNVPEYVRKASALFPFIRFYYKSIPDQMRMMFKFGLMHDIFAGKRSLQNAVGIPEIPFESEYLKKSPNIRFMDPDSGKEVSIDLSWPYEQMLSIDLMRNMASGPLRLLGPVGQIPFHAMGMQTFPRLQPYGKAPGSANPKKVDVPAYMAILPDDVINNPKAQKVMGFGWRYDGDTGQKILQMNKQSLELWHDFNPWFLDLYQNTKNSKIILRGGQLDEEAMKELWDEQAKAWKEKRILDKQQIKELTPFGKKPMEKIGIDTEKYKFPGVSEYDPALMLYDGLQRLDSLLARQDVAQNLNITPRGYSWVDTEVKIKEFDEMNKLMGEFIKYNDENWNYKSIDDIRGKVEKMSKSLEEEFR